MDIREIRREAQKFDRTLRKLKASIAAPEFDWYPYGWLTSLDHLDRLLTGERRRLLDLIGNGLVLDAGCGDGELAFFLESLGRQVHAVDYPATSNNGMRGVWTLRQALNSSVQVHAVDLDSHFTLPARSYRLVLLLGVLYHLKNPFYLLEHLAKHAMYCLLSTRVARYSARPRVEIRDVPVAYLLGEKELNEDPTNHWIFSEAGLRRLLEKTNWEICDYVTTGNVTDSDPVSIHGDERAFALLRSRAVELGRRVELLTGWHELEDSTWRWTEREFSARLCAPPGCRKAVLRLEFTLPPALIERLHSVTVEAMVGGVALPPEVYAQSGEHSYVQVLPQAVIQEGPIEASFRLDRALAPDHRDARELGLLVSGLELDCSS